MSTHEADRDAQWCAAQDAAALGEHAAAPASDEDPRWSAETAFYEELQARGQGVGDGTSPADAGLIEAALAAEAVSEDATPTSRRRRWLVPLVAVAAAAMIWVMWPGAGPQISGDGVWIARQDGERVVADEALPLAMWLVAQDEACGTIDDATFCATAGSVVRITIPERGGRARVEVERGSISVRSGSVTVATATSEHVLRAGQSAAAQATPASPPPPVVVSPPNPVPADRHEGQTAGETGTAGDRAGQPDEPPARLPSARRPSAPPAAPADAKAMLANARALRGQGERRQAASVYAKLLSRFPGSAEAQAARVSLGQLRLASGRAKSALALFNRYLKQGGPLAEEALWGKVQALDALGRDVQATVNTLQRRFPRSVYLERAKERLP